MILSFRNMFSIQAPFFSRKTTYPNSAIYECSLWPAAHIFALSLSTLSYYPCVTIK